MPPGSFRFTESKRSELELSIRVSVAREAHAGVTADSKKRSARILRSMVFCRDHMILAKTIACTAGSTLELPRFVFGDIDGVVNIHVRFSFHLITRSVGTHAFILSQVCARMNFQLKSALS